MSESNLQSPPRQRAPLLVESLPQTETTEAFVEKHFRECPLHRCKSTAEFDVSAVVADHATDLVRSSQELEPGSSGVGYAQQWTMLLFKRSPRLFWHFLIKSNVSYGEKLNSPSYTLTVTSESTAEAAREVQMLQQKYTIGDDVPGFLLMQSVNSIKRVPVQAAFQLTPEMLNLHYGAGFDEWAKGFTEGLRQNGLSILRGKPGTGKTSFLRHIIFSLSDTHRFYYIPTDSFGLLNRNISDFLLKEKKRHANRVFVIVLEDAEQLLAGRQEERSALTSSLLNFTDGFMGDLANAHLICTVNSAIKDLDEAVLRPGRQRSFREFSLLEWPQAKTLAAKLGITLEEERSYSLAEIYHFKDLQSSGSLLSKEQSLPIGFGVA